MSKIHYSSPQDSAYLTGQITLTHEKKVAHSNTVSLQKGPKKSSFNSDADHAFEPSFAINNTYYQA